MAFIRQISESVHSIFNGNRIPLKKVAGTLPLPKPALNADEFYRTNSKNVMGDREERILSGLWSA